MIDEDEFIGRIFEIIERIETVYMFEPINDRLLWQLRAEFLTLFQEVGNPERVEVKVELNKDDPTGVTINFFQGNNGPMLKELNQIYNCLVFNNPTGLRVV